MHKPSPTTPTLVLNQAATAAPEKAPAVKGAFATFRTNVSKAKVRHETLKGKKHLVVPMIMITEGVLNGSSGPLLYPGEELAKTPAAWDAKPVTIQHPTKNGKGVSACTPEMLEAFQCGLILNSRTETGTDAKGATIQKLHAEAWLDEVRTNEIDDRILARLEKGEVIELSTGLFTDNEPADDGAVFNGEAYTAVARNYRPDHLAILPDTTGACSVAKGAGLLRTNASHDQIREGLGRALEAKHGYDAPYISDVYDSGAILSGRKGALSHQGYKVGAKGVELVGDPTPVTKKVEYHNADGEVVANGELAHAVSAALARNEAKGSLAKALLVGAGFERDGSSFKLPDGTEATINEGAKRTTIVLTAPTTNTKESNMDRKAFIALLIANSAGVWDEGSRPFLDKMSDAQLKTLAPVTNEATPPTEDLPVEDETPEPEVKPTKAAKPTANAGPVLSREDRDALNYGKRKIAEERAGLTKTITANKRNEFTPAELAAMTIDALKKTAKGFAPEPVANYAGLGETFEANAEDGPEVLPLPRTWDEPVAK